MTASRRNGSGSGGCERGRGGSVPPTGLCAPVSTSAETRGRTHLPTPRSSAASRTSSTRGVTWCRNDLLAVVFDPIGLATTLKGIQSVATTL